MSADSIHENYHSFIDQLRSLDPIVHKMRYQGTVSWRKKAWKGPLSNMKVLFKAAGPLAKIQWLSLPVIGSVIAYASHSISNIPVWMMITACVILLVLVYWILVLLHTNKMTSITSHHFDVAAFKEKKPAEYLIWAPIVENSRTTFNGLFNEMSQLLTPNYSQILEIIEHSKGQTEELRSSNDIITAERNYLLAEIEKYERTVGYLIQLIKAANKSVSRFVNNSMNFYELDFICAYTIYKVKDEKLYKFIDKGTSGASPEIIEITQQNALRYAVVDVAMSHDDSIKYNNPYPGRTVVSYLMKMLDGEQWIWSFHFDDTNHMALNLTLSDDIIEIREVYRMIHSFCLLIQKDMLSNSKGRDLNVDLGREAKKSNF
ncbi:hypothetical protein [Paenibacillus tepidiphilus]|uniref:hypothetical protein n=1 Tax=Paenibacillus tepidiphilus TaxID=2608683 RepID=UPI00123925A2|nr:hypothetical protein [Paenibacillus tepidiphilus]